MAKTIKITKRRFVPRSKDHTQQNAEAKAQWVYLYLVEGWTLRQIAMEYDVSAPTVREAIAAAGAPLRPRGARMTVAH